MAKVFSGIEREEETSAKSLIRDTRPLGQKVSDALSNPYVLATCIGGLGIISFVFPFPLLPEVSLGAGGWLAWFGLTRKSTLPFRMPMSGKVRDWNDLSPADGSPNMSRGIGYYGNRLYDDGEIWFSDDDLRTHILIFGSTGSGKTEALLSFAYNALNQGSGFIYVDGKGDNSLWAKVFGMVRNRGREDDLLVINYMTGNSDVSEGPKATRLSNTTNPFANGSSDGLTQLLVGLMDGGGGDKGGDMWKGRAISMISGLMMALVAMRDRGEILLDVQSIREYMNIDKIIGLAKDESLPEKARNALKSYLDSLPGFVWKKGANQGDTTLEQHGYLQMQFTKIMGSLSDTYGHIFRTQLGEVDFYDVVVNRRILVVLLPALEKSPDELANLGKIIVASLKSMMATGLGAGIEGLYKDVIEAKPNNSPAPFTTILDEYGYYAVSGSAVMPAQARSLGFSMIFAGQDLPAFEKASPEEASSIIGNCNIKIFMKLEEPEKTYQLFEKSVGEAYVTHTGGYQNNSASLLGNIYQDTNNASVEKRSRGSMQDLQKQGPGEAHILFGGSVVRMKMFRANPPTPKNMKMRVNRFLKVKPPSRELMESFNENARALFDNLTSPDFVAALQAPAESIDISIAASCLEHNFTRLSTEIGIAALAEYRQALDAAGGPEAMQESGSSPDGIEGFVTEEGQGMVFSDKSVDDMFLTELLGDEAASDIVSMMNDEPGQLSRRETKKGVADIEVALGNDKADAEAVAEAVTKAMDDATGYPSLPVESVEVSDWVEAMSEIDNYISLIDADKSDDKGE